MTPRVLTVLGLILAGALFTIGVWPAGEAQVAMCAPSAEPVIL